MGIEGLLKNLKKCIKEKNLEEYRGQRAAVDTYSWLHKIIKGPSGKQIVTGKDPTRFVNDCMRRVDKIRKCGIELTCVFDGGMLPRKTNEEESRRKRRQENFEKGKELMSRNNTEQGLKRMIESIDVSPDVAYKLIQVLKKEGVKIIVAPYEADAQLAYLSRQDFVDFIITEDSDLLAFGAKRILYKLDFSTLNGEEIQLENIPHDDEAGFKWFTHNMFLSTCIMAGCDYLNQIKGVGMKLAQKVVAKNHTIKKALAQISQGKQIPEGYEQNFLKAMLTFRFQRVYCPKRQACVSVNQMQPMKWRSVKQIPQPMTWVEEVLDLQMLEYALKLPNDVTHPDWQFLGRKLEDKVAKKVAEGELNPINFLPYDQECLQKLRYDSHPANVPFFNKKSSTLSLKQTPKTSILQYMKPVQKKNPLEYKSMKNRSISEQDYKVFNLEQKSVNSYFPVSQVSKPEVQKKALRFNDDSDEQQESKQQVSVVSVSQGVEMIESSPEVILSSEDVNSAVLTAKSSRAQTYFRNKLEEISQTMFTKLFSDEFLHSPFSC